MLSIMYCSLWCKVSYYSCSRIYYLIQSSTVSNSLTWEKRIQYSKTYRVGTSQENSNVHMSVSWFSIFIERRNRKECLVKYVCEQYFEGDSVFRDEYHSSGTVKYNAAFFHFIVRREHATVVCTDFGELLPEGPIPKCSLFLRYVSWNYESDWLADCAR